MGYQTKLQEGRGGGAVSTNFPKMNAPPPVYFEPERYSLPPAPVSLSTCLKIIIMMTCITPHSTSFYYLLCEGLFNITPKSQLRLVLSKC